MRSNAAAPRRNQRGAGRGHVARRVRHYHQAVQHVRELVDQGNRDRASLLLTDGPVMDHMRSLRRASLMLVEAIDNIELFVSEERASRA